MKMDKLCRYRSFAAVMVAVFICVTFFTGGIAVPAEQKQDSGKQVAQTDFQRLEGRWVRPDGGYVLELRNVKRDGSMTAAYYNPRPIRVFRAEAAKKDGVISLSVELRDANYPGSTYRLKYDAAADRLVGTYFQAVERQTFEIMFIRAR